VVWPGNLETFGPIGIILKPRSDASIASICVDDAASHIDPVMGKRIGTGLPFSSQAVLDTFANASRYNEWIVRNADTIGVFVHPSDPWHVARPMQLADIPGLDQSMGDGELVGSVSVSLPDIITAFPGLPVYSFSGGEIVKVEPCEGSLRCSAIDPAELYR